MQCSNLHVHLTKQPRRCGVHNEHLASYITGYLSHNLLVMISIAQLIKASNCVCKGPVQASAMFLNKMNFQSFSLSLFFLTGLYKQVFSRKTTETVCISAKVFQLQGFQLGTKRLYKFYTSLLYIELILHGYSEISAHLYSESANMICLRHLLTSTAVSYLPWFKLCLLIFKRKLTYICTYFLIPDSLIIIIVERLKTLLISLQEQSFFIIYFLLMLASFLIALFLTNTISLLASIFTHPLLFLSLICLVDSLRWTVSPFLFLYIFFDIIFPCWDITMVLI